MRKGLSIAGIFLSSFAVLMLESKPSFAVEKNGEATSVGKIRLVTNNKPTKPKDPSDPNKANNSKDDLNSETNNPGPLSLDVVPKGFYFGNQKMYHAAHDYFATGLNNYTQYLQVTDNRDADIFGWTLRVMQVGDFVDSTNKNTLKGAFMKLPKGLSKGTNDGGDKLFTQSLDLSQEEQVIFKAKSSEKNGKGTSISSWDSEDVMLHIPKNTAQPGNYQAMVYWILSTEITN